MQIQVQAVGMLVERWESWGSSSEEVLAAFGGLAQQKRSQLGMKQQIDVGRMVEQTQDERYSTDIDPLQVALEPNIQDDY